jgi:hypothetical protein
VADASYPPDLKYHAEHDWARIDGDTATLGSPGTRRTSSGEVVFFDPPEVGKSITKDEPYAEVESVKAVSDVVAPRCRARSSKSTRRWPTRPRTSTTTRTARAGWSGSGCRSRRGRRLMDAETYEQTLS